MKFGSNIDGDEELSNILPINEIVEEKEMPKLNISELVQKSMDNMTSL